MNKVLFINGIKDVGTVRVKKIIDNNTLQYYSEGTCNVYPLLEHGKYEPTVLTLDANPSQDININDVSLIFNQVSDPDTHKITLAKAKAICDQLKGTANCVNHPDKIISTPRDQMHNILANVPGIIVPQTSRCSPSSAQQVAQEIKELGWAYPVLIRRCGDHNAKSLTLLTQADDTSSLDPELFDDDCYLTEYIDSSDDNGVFTKYRFVSVQGNAFVRHVMYGDTWEIHSHVRKNFMQQNSQYFEMEKEIMSSFEDKLKLDIQQTVRDIYEATGLEYFGIDCSINKAGKLIIFESNANMNLLYNPYPKPNSWQEQVDQIQTAIVTMIESMANKTAAQ